MRVTWFVPPLVSLLVIAPAWAGQTQAPDVYARCRDAFARRADYDAAFCFAQTTMETQQWREGERVFDALAAAQPGNPSIRLAYGHLFRTRDPRRAETLFRDAADAFRRAGDADGEVSARGVLRDFYFPLGRVREADAAIARIAEIGVASADPLLRARAWSLQAGHVQASGGDLGHAYRLLKQAEAVIFPGGPYRPKRQNLNSLGQVATRMGRLDDAMRAFAQLDELATREGDAPTQAAARFNVYTAVALKEGVLPTPGGRDRVHQLAQRALDAATQAQHQVVMMRSHSALAELEAHTPGGQPSALAHAEACLSLAVAARQSYDEAVCSWIEAALTSGTDGRRARIAELRALDAAARSGNPRTQAYSAGRHMRHSWRTKPRERALLDSLSALDAIETLRALQDDAASSADLFSAWTLDYYWLSGRLLTDGREGDLDVAFSITERMRARALFDVLGQSRPPLDGRHPAVVERREALSAIAALQRELMRPSIDEGLRRTRLVELERMERREQEARRQIALAFPRERGDATAFATLPALRVSLGPDEAFLSFQVGIWTTYEGDDAGGSWVVAVTRDRTTVHRLPDRTRLTDVVPMFVGLLHGRERRETPAAVRLYDEVLREALAALPAGVTRLIVAADGPLHQLPLEVLRASAGAPPLGERYEIVHVPSATLYLQWRSQTSGTGSGRTLTFADPDVAAAAADEDDTRSGTILLGARLGRLPHARAEGRAIARHVAAADVLVGAAASERALKSAALDRYSVLHFAAHAVADDAHHERSAVFLAPGDATEDGLLQAREIEALDLDGGIVVLSACQTAAGAVQSGEGVLSLARAFFAAGAQSVIGSRWPLRDADAALLFDRFYHHLGQGDSLAAALKAAQRDARDEGLTPSAWAGLILLGNGDPRPFLHSPRPATGTQYAPIGLLALGSLALCGVLLVRRTRAARA